MKKYKKFRNISLKQALMKQNFPRSKSVNWKDKSNNEKNNSINKINANNIKIIKEKKERNNFDTLDLYSNIKNENDMAEKIYKANKLKIKESEIEDEEINSLNEQIRQIMLNNFEIQTKIENQLNMRYIYEKNQKSIASYINDLNYQFRNYDNTINQYEATINKMKKENRKLQNDYDKKIEAIDNENDKLKKRIKDRIELYMHQKGIINEKSAKTKNIENEIKIQKDIIKERVDINKKKVNELENKYDTMFKKLIDIEVNCEDTKIKKMLKNSLYTIEEINKQNENKIINDKNKNENENENEDVIHDINQKIEDYKSNNDDLLFELKELKKQYEELTKNKDNIKETKNSIDKKPRYSRTTTMKSTNSNFFKETQSDHKYK